MLHKQHQIETDDLFNLDVDVDLGSSSSRAITGPVSTSSSKAKSNASAKTQPRMLADKEEGVNCNGNGIFSFVLERNVDTVDVNVEQKKINSYSAAKTTTNKKKS